MKKLLAVGAAVAAMCAVGGERIVFVGDSITGQSRNHGEGFARQLDAAYEATIAEPEDRPTVISLGGSGQTVESWLSVEKNSRENKQTTLDVAGVYVGENLDQHADRVVIMLGMNNVLSPTTLDTPESIATYKSNYLTLISKVVERTTPTHLYLASVPPCTEDAAGPKNLLIQKLNAVISELVAEVGASRSCTYLPAWENQVALIAAGRRLSPDFHVTGDMVHPNDIGHVRLAKTFLDGFGHTAASAWLDESRLQPKLDATATANRAGLSHVLKATGAGSAAGLYAFDLTANWVVRPGETAPASAAFALTLPDGWAETADPQPDGLLTVFHVEGPAELAATPVVVTATPASGDPRTATVNVPAPWRVSTPVRVNWSNASGQWKYNPGSACETEAAILAGKAFAEIEAADQSRTPSWLNYFASVDYAGGDATKSLDFSSVSFYSTFGTAYAMRYVHAKRATDATLALSSSTFSATLDTEVWVNGKSVLVSDATSASVLVRLSAGNNVIVVRSSHTTWQWQLGVELTPVDNSVPLRYGLAPLADREDAPSAGYEPEIAERLIDGSVIYAIRSNCNFRLNRSGRADVFLVGGGGGGGGNYEDVIVDTQTLNGGYAVRPGGGGGGGGVVYRTGLTIAADTDYPIVIGAGGPSNTSGEPTTAFGLEALGGGHGGRNDLDAASGGSGGGAGSMSKVKDYTDGAAAAVPAEGEAQGFGGGKGYSDNYNSGGAGGGGGGALGAGGDANGSTAGAGGVGRACPFLKDSPLFGAGGKGGATNGGQNPVANSGASAENGTGNGGDGCRSYNHINAGRGGSGGSGVVYVRFYPDEFDPADYPLQASVSALPDGRVVYTYNRPGTGCFVPPAAGTVQVFVVGGGGGGGGNGIPREDQPTDSGTYSGGGYSTRGGGGGGGGAVMSNDAVTVEKKGYLITVGAGGLQNANGGASYAFGIEAPGGGAGAWNDAAAQAGGPGGGGNFNHTAGASAEGYFAGGSGIEVPGNKGLGGGGAGAGGAGADATSSNAGVGGAGVGCPYLADDKVYGAGGKGGASGGQQSPLYHTAPDAPDGTGQGGQGCNSWYHINAGAGGAGGCGCVIIVCSPGSDYFKECVKLEATGGEKKTVRDAQGKKWIVHAFYSNDTLTVSQPMCAQAFLVGGGGAGGKASNVRGGGGGAGGVVLVEELYLLPGDHAVVVGQGGGKGADGYGESGTSSSIDGAFEALGGGGGGNSWEGAGLGGGSGGGSCAPYSPTKTEMTVSGGAGASGQGHAGGSCAWTNAEGTGGWGGGGGGAGSAGIDGTKGTVNRGQGGDAVQCDFLGKGHWYAAGGGSGGGGNSDTPKGGGYWDGDEFVQLGGRGGYYVYNKSEAHPGTDGAPNTGSGGGGEGSSGNMNSGWGKGADGIVIIRYRPIPNGLMLMVR